MRTLDEIKVDIQHKRSQLDSCEDLENAKAIASEIEMLESEQEQVMAKLEREKQSLQERVNKYEEQVKEERNQKIITDGFNPLGQMKKEERQMEEKLTVENVRSSAEYRTAWAKKLMFREDFTEAEKRALDVATTTTDTTFVEPSSSVDGINNGGLFIPEQVALDILKEVELESPFLADAAKSYILGNIKYPYRKSTTGAKAVEENTDNSLASEEYAELVLTSKEFSKTVRVTWKLESMAVEEFIKYIVEEIGADLREELGEESIYGEGGTEHMTGATKDAIAVEYDGTTTTVMDAIAAGLKSLPKRKRAGAIIYISDDIETDILFAKDKNGAYLNSPLILSGITRIGPKQVKTDPFLKDGEFLIGNAKRYYRMNFNEPFSITKDVLGRQRKNDYTGYTVVAGAPVPNSFVHGKKKYQQKKQTFKVS